MGTWPGRADLGIVLLQLWTSISIKEMAAQGKEIYYNFIGSIIYQSMALDLGRRPSALQNSSFQTGMAGMPKGPRLESSKNAKSRIAFDDGPLTNSDKLSLMLNGRCIDRMVVL